MVKPPPFVGREDVEKEKNPQVSCKKGVEEKRVPSHDATGGANDGDSLQDGFQDSPEEQSNAGWEQFRQRCKALTQDIRDIQITLKEFLEMKSLDAIDYLWSELHDTMKSLHEMLQEGYKPFLATVPLASASREDTIKCMIGAINRCHGQLKAYQSIRLHTRRLI